MGGSEFKNSYHACCLLAVPSDYFQDEWYHQGCHRQAKLAQWHNNVSLRVLNTTKLPLFVYLGKSCLRVVGLHLSMFGEIRWQRPWPENNIIYHLEFCDACIQLISFLLTFADKACALPFCFGGHTLEWGACRWLLFHWKGSTRDGCLSTNSYT